MKAWVFRAGGKPTSVLKLESDYPRPTPGAGQLLIQVKAISLNPVGWKSMSLFPIRLLQKKPGVPESDFAGIVVGGDLDQSGFKVGDEVFGITPADVVTKSGQGTLAEYTVVDRTVVKKPASLSFEDAASFPLAGLTAWHALVDVGGLVKGGPQKRVFINGATGGVGLWGIQIAKAYGAHVVATCSEGSEQLVKSLGADETIDYKSVDLPSHLTKNYSVKEGKAFDIVFDPIGSQPLFAATPAFLTPTGPYLDLMGGIHLDSLSSALHSVYGLVNHLARPRLLGGTPRAFKMLLLPADKMRAQLEEAAGMLERGELKAVIDSTYKFEDAHKAYEKQMSGRAKGKVIITV